MFEVRDLVELQVLHKALMAARFTGSDIILLGSPYLSILHTLVVDEIIARNRADARFGDAARWEKWREISSDRPEWDYVRRQFSERRNNWSVIPQPEQRDFLRTCFAPFVVSEELLDEMVLLLSQPVPGSLLVEEEDRWILPLAGRAVRQCLVDWALTLCCEGEYEVRIEGPFTFRDAAGGVREIDPEDPAALADALRVVRSTVSSAAATKSGQLELSFADGSELVVPVDSFEAWGLVGPGGLRVVSLPGGDLALWS